MPVRGVLFDMGGTLLHYSAPGANWEDTEKTGAAGVYALLQEADYELPSREQALTQRPFENFTSSCMERVSKRIIKSPLRVWRGDLGVR
jgi:FMN phosphatase YigB (HAD superfamily)